ncbi:FtsK/SpoIIIE domain-containing protein [Nocardia wallacei]|uniref:FtsK/SpoIIIE domain-containing protein n=1 Tax=Nocardia wallacei TaxID=480035 RepID=UPI0024559A23|nr:FtsK/SpoIIIE domain-containing protein [Nocardia wallacei]
MSPSRSSDPLVRWVEETLGDVFAPAPRRQNATGAAPGDSDQIPSRFVPVCLPTVVAAGAAVYATQLTAALPENDKLEGIRDLLTTLGQWQWQVLLVVLAVLAVATDLLRVQARRHRTALRRQIRKTTQISPTSLRVTWLPGKLPPRLWLPGLRTPRRAVARVELGTVLDGTRLAALRTAIQDTAGPVWDMDVQWDAPARRVTIHRGRAGVTEADLAAGARSSRHRALDATFGRSPLRNAVVTPIIDEHETRPAFREIGYIVEFTSALGVGRRAAQVAFEQALQKILGPHPSGRLWKFDWQLGHHNPDEEGYLGGEKARLVIELQADLPKLIAHTPPDLDGLTSHQRYMVPFGVGVGGRIGAWNVSWKSNVPHALVIGPTGGGKTSLLRTLITELVLRGIPVLAIDPKKIELDGMETWPGVAGVVYTLRDSCELISAVHAEMHARLDWVHATKVPNTELQIFAVILDELFIFSGMVQRAMKSADKTLSDWVKTEDPLGKLADIAALIRSAGGRRADGVQRPDAQIYGDAGGNVRDNYGTRISLAKLSADGAYMMWGDSNIGRDVDTSIPGRAVATDERGEPFDVQIMWTPDVDDHPNKRSRLSEDDLAIVTALQPASAPTFVAFSGEMRRFLTKHGGRYDTPPRIDGVPENTAERVLARDLVAGDRLHHVDTESGAKVTAIVSKVRVDGSSVFVDLVSSSRPRWQVECRLDEYVDADLLGEGR